MTSGFSAADSALPRRRGARIEAALLPMRRHVRSLQKRTSSGPPGRLSTEGRGNFERAWSPDALH
jgi:hypothetical protein